MLIDATSTSVTFQFVTRTGLVVDSYTIGTPAVPAAPTNLTTSVISPAQINLSWTDNAGGGAGFKIERSTDGTNFTQIATTAAGATTYQDSGLAPGTYYEYRVLATNTAGDSTASNTASATTPTNPLTYLSDLPWVSATVGWGTIQKDLSIKGNPITLNGVVYAKGLGVHATSTVVYNLAGQYSSFASAIGIDSEVNGNGSVDFQVLADGVKIYDSGLMLGTSATQSLNLNVAGVNQLTLIVTDGGDGIDYDHADWAGARLLAPSTPPPVVPTNLVATAVSASKINLLWDDSDTSVTGYNIERATDGVNFSLLATTPATTKSYSDTSVTAGTSYQYRVRATNAAGNSAPSNIATATPLTPPVAPGTLTATVASGNQVNLAWVNNATNQTGFTVERSTDATNFAMITSLDDTARTYSDTTVVAGTTYTYRVYAVNAAGPSAYSNTASATPAAVALPAPWQDGDIGAVGLAGGSSVAGGTFTVKGAGTDIWGQADSLHYVYQPLNGDGQIVARVESEQNTNVAAKAGVMIRESLAAGSAEVSVAVTPSNGIVFLQRASTGGSSTVTTIGSAVAPYWVKLVRVGNTITGYASADGVTWQQVGTTTVAMATNVDIGLMVSAKNNTVLNTSTFDNVAATGPGIGAPPQAPPAAPGTLTATVASGTQVNLAWVNNATNQTGFTVQRSPDGTNFTTIASVNWSATTYSDTAVLAGTTYTYRVSAQNAVGASAYSNTASATTPTAQPVTWQDGDIGAVGLAGSSSVAGGTFTVKGSGSDIWGQADSFNYVYQSLNGDGQIVARVASQQNTQQWAKAGVMIRESLAAGSAEVSVAVTPSNGIAFLQRATTGGSSTVTTTGSAVAPYWVKLVRVGNTITGYASADGVTWQQVGTTTVTMATNVYIGLMVSAKNNTVLNTSTFDNVSATGPGIGAPPQAPPAAPGTLTATVASGTQVNLAWVNNATNQTGFTVQRSPDGTNFTTIASVSSSATTYSDTAVLAGTTYTYRVSAQNAVGASAYSNTASATTLTAQPVTWQDGDIGAVGLAGSSSVAGGTFTVKGSGSDIWGQADSFNYVYQSLNGDGQIVARVASQQNTQQWAKAGVMIRESLAAGSAEVSVAVTPSNGIAFLQRATTGGSSTVTTTGSAVAPYWVKLVRVGNTITGYASADGVTWQQVGTTTVTMATNVYIGLMVSAKNNTVLNTSTFDNVSATGPGITP